MPHYDIRTLQLHILEILSTVDRVCRDNNIRYYIADGTMLGAIRHKGFIPWDDDIDIGIPRKDYDLLIQNAEKWLPKPYELICAENDVNYPFPFAKVQDANTTLIERKSMKYIGGVYIDIFPMDGVPDGKMKQKIHFAKYQYYKKLLYYIYRDPYKHGKGVQSWIPLLSRKLFKFATVQKSVRNLLRKYDFDENNNFAIFDDGKKSIMPKTVLGKPTPILFEDKIVLGIEKYDVYLTKLYGNYMQIPPVEKQKIHGFYYVDLNKPYKENHQLLLSKTN